MAVQSIDGKGNFTWICPHQSCGTEGSAHISHEAIQWHGHSTTPSHQHTVSLPRCQCGAQTFLKVHFTDQELRAPNMIDFATGQPTASHAMAQRHMELAKQLIAAGKVPATDNTH